MSVPPDLARRVVGALALQDATIRAGVLTGAASGRPSAPRTSLPALDACGPSASP